jgi:hypothetical protein
MEGSFLRLMVRPGQRLGRGAIQGERDVGGMSCAQRGALFKGMARLQWCQGAVAGLLLVVR